MIHAKEKKEARRGSYGIDAPYLLAVPALLIVWNVTEGILYQRALPFFVAALLVASIGCGLYTSRRGKFIVWDRLLDGLDLRGDERIVDLGCGPGAVLLMAATRLTTARAVGVDLWRTRDQSGNAEEATRANAEAEGVSDRVDLQTSDLRALPFPDESFDVVLSSMAIHSIKGAEERAKAIDEAPFVF